MKKFAIIFTLFVFVLLSPLYFSSPSVVSARPLLQATAGGLSVSNAILNLAATPGMVYEHKMQIGTGAGGPPLDMTVEVMGFGEGPGGEFVPVPSAQDTSQYSGRTWITKISNTKFHLDPGGTVEVDATVTVPQDPGSDTRYAIIYIHSDPVSGAGNIGQILSVSVPVIITPPNAALTQTGSITDVTVSSVEAGKPINIQAMVKNTGNRHFKIKGTADILDSSGNVVTKLIFPTTSTSIFPTFTRQVDFSYSGLDQPTGLKVGKYTVDVKIMHEDDSLVDEKKTEMKVTQPYTPFADIDVSLVSFFNFNNQEPGTVNAKDKADLEIQFEGTGPVTGNVAVAKYPQEPSGLPRFSDDLGNGGTGQTALKYAAVRVSGFNKGLAHIIFQYQNNELGDKVTANSLFLAYRQVSHSWSKLDNLEVQTGAGVVRGDITVPVLTQGVVIGIGGGDVVKAIGPNPAQTPEQGSNQSTNDPWLLYGGAGLGGVVVIGLVIFLLVSRKR